MTDIYNAKAKLTYEYLGKFMGLADVAECGLSPHYVIGKMIEIRDEYQRQFKQLSDQDAATGILLKQAIPASKEPS